MDTTYSYTKQQGTEPFDWNRFLEREDQTQDEWDLAAELSANWVTCACGAQCAALGRYNDGTPTDTQLAMLGTDFHEFILAEEREEALYTLERIEERSAYLLSQM